jgi:site-specific DNA-cytosine methylase
LEAPDNEMKPTNAPTSRDLFCGAGGLSLGFGRAGFAPMMALESEGSAVETYRRNLGACGTISSAKASARPPCGETNRSAAASRRILQPFTRARPWFARSFVRQV